MSSIGPLRLPLVLPRVQRVEDERVVAGVCAGIGRALDVDATFVRLAFALFAFASGAGIVAYRGLGDAARAERHGATSLNPPT